MNNTVEFILQLKDLMSGGLRNVQSIAQSSFRAVEQSIERSRGKSNMLGSNIRQLNEQLNRLRETRELSIDTRHIRSLNREIEQVERQINRLENLGTRRNGGNSMLGSFVGGNLIARGISMAGSMVKDMIGDSMTASMQAAQKKVSFQTMAGNKAGSQLYGDLTKFAQDSIFGNELYQNAQTMLAFGANVQEVMPDLKMLGDISMGDKERLGSLTLAFSQVRSAGRLMGQDLLQLVNAGFNPLQIISEKTGVSLANLKKKMEEGKISFDMVKQAFVDATSKGGMFYQMADRIAETSFGKWEALKGQWEGTLIDIGNAIMPVASSMMDAAADTLHFLSISKTAPETLTAEKFEINALVNSIIGLNDKNELRGRLIDMLKAKAPDMFSDLDREKTKNSELLSILDKVNVAYTRKIGLASYDLRINKNKEEANNLLQLATKALAQAEENPRGFDILSRWDRIKMMASGVGSTGDMTAEGLKMWAEGAKKKAGGFLGDNPQLEANKRVISLVDRVETLRNDPAALKAQFAGRNDGLKKYTEAVEKATKLINTGKYKQAEKYQSLIEKLLDGKAEATKATPPGVLGAGLDTSSVSDRSGKISSGGVRNINITIGKFFEDFIIKTETVQEGLGSLQDKVEECLYRVLNSGNAIQDN
ncbi:MAG: tape measure protein [Bacteroidetes bacterium]|nr:tape measure protein [Bacteroidota bacterium]